MRRLLPLIVFSTAPAGAEQACPAPTMWNAPARHLAARVPEMKYALKPDTATDLTLLPSEQVRLALATSSRTRPGSWAGLAAIDVSKPGKLDVVLSTATYVDLIQGGRALKSASFGQPKGCQGVHKSVTFDVGPGRYVVQLTGAPDKNVRMATVLR